jgi:hypothetical protein
MTRLIHITPQLPPNVGGIADYAVILGRRVAEQSDGHVQSAYVQAGSKDNDAPADDLDSIDLADQRSSQALAEAVGAYAEEPERAAVLLHFVGYGYQQRGCPLWLVRALKQLRAERPSVRRITMFHELYATSSKPWTSAFWTMPVQRYIASKVARLSDGLLTNRQKAGQWLHEQVHGQPVRVSPTFSNVGEPETLPSYTEREPYAVLFGGAGRKTTTCVQHSAALGRALRRMGVKRIVDIGTPVQDSAADALPLPVEAKGVLPAKEVSTCLRRASVGVLRYPLDFITKSGIWAGYAAHGVPPLLVAQRQPVETLEEGRHFMLLDALNGEVPDERQRGSASRTVKQWYDEWSHSRRAASKLVRLLGVQAQHFQSLPKK